MQRSKPVSSKDVSTRSKARQPLMTWFNTLMEVANHIPCRAIFGTLHGDYLLTHLACPYMSTLPGLIWYDVIWFSYVWCFAFARRQPQECVSGTWYSLVGACPLESLYKKTDSWTEIDADLTRWLKQWNRTDCELPCCDADGCGLGFMERGHWSNLGNVHVSGHVLSWRRGST